MELDEEAGTDLFISTESKGVISFNAFPKETTSTEEKVKEDEQPKEEG